MAAVVAAVKLTTTFPGHSSILDTMAIVKVGDVLEDRYRIAAPIARGGMSTVYRGVDLRLGRSVAVKVMDEAFVDDHVFQQRFRREARSMARLNHPNLVNVFDFYASESHAYLVMELITGGTLRELLAERGPMPPHAATGVMRGMLTGLATAHRAGLVHRDIKPDNVLITSDHMVKLSDFGLVRAASAGRSLDDKIIGTVAYLSPEQVEGGDIGPQSDVYSAGIVLFELLTGTTPFQGEDDLDRAYARLDTVVPAPSSLIDGVPPLFDELVATATARQAEERFSDASDFLNALEDVAAELHLPGFKVPAPLNSAANRASESMPDAQHTDMFTTQLPAQAPPVTPGPLGYPGTDETSVIAVPDPPAQETSILPAQPATVPAPVPAEIRRQPETALHRPTEVEKPSIGPEESPDLTPVTNRSRLSMTLWIIFVSVLVAAVAVGGWWFGSGRYGEIPQVLGMEEFQAVAVVEEAGFNPVTVDRYDNAIPVGAIIGTDPSFGERLPRGGDVSVLVSQGRPSVPDLGEDRSVATVRSALEERTLIWVDASGEYSDDVAEGDVASLSPRAGTTLDTGSTVQVHLSRGPAPVAVPDVSDMGVDQATRVLERAGLAVSGVEEAFSPDIRGGRVFATSPESSTELRRGDSVVLRVSTAVAVPDVVGMSRAEATETLAESGLGVAGVQVIAGESARSADTVVSVSPESGGLVDPAQPQVTLGLAGEIEVPNLIGRRIGDARTILEDAGLVLRTDAGDSERVWSQSPRARSEISAGGEVEVQAF